MRAVVFIGLGMILGGIIAAHVILPETDEAFQEQRAETVKANAMIQAQQEEQARYATILLEPNQGQDFIMGALGLLLGAPSGAIQMAQGLAPPQPKWILRGKQRPMSSIPGAHFTYVDLKTNQTEGPFKPEAPAATASQSSAATPSGFGTSQTTAPSPPPVVSGEISSERDAQIWSVIRECGDDNEVCLSNAAPRFCGPPGQAWTAAREKIHSHLGQPLALKDIFADCRN